MIRFWFCLLSLLSINHIDAQGIQTELRQAWDRFAEHWENENAEACAIFYLEDGVHYPPNSKINQGRNDIQSFYQMLFDAHQSSAYHHEINDILQGDGFLVEFGKFGVDWTRNDDSTWTFKARSVTEWRYGADGSWKIAKFLFQPAP